MFMVLVLVVILGRGCRGALVMENKDRSFFYGLDQALYTWAIDPPPGLIVRLIRRFFKWLHNRG